MELFNKLPLTINRDYMYVSLWLDIPVFTLKIGPYTHRVIVSEMEQEDNKERQEDSKERQEDNKERQAIVDGKTG